VSVLAAKRSLLRRAKRSERDFAKWLLANDAPDPKYKHLTTSTGRIGHIYALRADCLSLHYLGENKNEIVPKKWLEYWALINEKADDFGKVAILRFEPSNKSVVSKTLPDMHVITPTRHAALLEKERLWDAYTAGLSALGA
jgi:hypothetical protein